MTYAAIKKMRLDHGARCSDPPGHESKIYFDWAMTQRAAREIVEAPSEPFKLAHNSIHSLTKQIGGILDTRVG